MAKIGERFGDPRQVDALGFTREDWIQEARIAEELSRRKFRQTRGYGMKSDEARYSAVSAKRACFSLCRKSKRVPDSVPIQEFELAWDPIPELEARSCLTSMQEEDPETFRCVAERFAVGLQAKSELRRLRRSFR